MKTKTNYKKIGEYWLFTGPAVFFFFLIVVIPFVMGMGYSFTDWNGVSSDPNMVGLSNFTHIFTDDPLFRDSFSFTLRFTVTAVILTNVIGFGLALLVTSYLKTQNMLRTAFFIPNVIGGLILGFIWHFIFTKGFPSFGNLTGIEALKTPWLGDASTAFWGLVIVFAWQLSGYMMVIYIAALQGIDQSLLEAAKIDGANSVQRLRVIVIPLIAQAFTICLFLTISHAFKIFDINYALTGGGPFQSTESLTIHIYEEAFRNNRYGIGAAKAFIFFLAVAAITIIQVSLTKRKEVEM
ncbi:carbohydrate ABC transporter permease [Marinicrinis sediminis]|uniref:Carbohydrate ABC transporter permease n=1 Tax=Marinicrinis sediminis TaxID=1652465 RepID=A0ABW5RHT8_9BACL